MSESAKKIVAVGNLHKSYEQGGAKLKVLDGLNFSVAAGETVAVLGVSGTGKSTFLNVLSGVDTIDEGQISVDGVVVSKLDAKGLAKYRRQKIGFIFQFYNLIPTLTALENVMSGWEAAGLPTSQGEREARGILTRLGLSEKCDKFPDQLSGGEQQRVAIARALVKKPALILADEPTGNLDPGTAEKVVDLLLEQSRHTRAALVIVTHNPAIGQITDRALMLTGGKLVPASSPDSNGDVKAA